MEAQGIMSEREVQFSEELKKTPVGERLVKLERMLNHGLELLGRCNAAGVPRILWGINELGGVAAKIPQIAKPDPEGIKEMAFGIELSSIRKAVIDETTSKLRQCKCFK